RKLPDYEEMGIAEYWIVDYLGIAAARHIGTPKLPTISIYRLEEGEYQLKQFREGEQVESAVLPMLNLTVDQIVQAGKVSA
ncbi:MAG: Uma2 family endonuclease, partial [Kovacikia sp.]